MHFNTIQSKYIGKKILNDLQFSEADKYSTVQFNKVNTFEKNFHEGNENFQL